jgi:hypothetical protein
MTGCGRLTFATAKNRPEGPRHGDRRRELRLGADAPTEPLRRVVMNDESEKRWGAPSGYLVFVLGIAAAAFERGAPPANAPVAETLAYLAQYRAELIAQSLLFVLSAGVYLWFFGSLRSFLLQAKGEMSSLADTGFGAGVLWAGIQMVMQSAQVALAMSAGGPLEPSLAALISDWTYALSVIAYMPMAVLLTATAVAGLRTRAMPVWLSGLSAVTAGINLMMSLGLIADRGPFVPGGLLTYVLYGLMVVWLLAMTTVMFVRLGKPLRNAPSLQGF